jgi:hypothetical protein
MTDHNFTLLKSDKKQRSLARDTRRLARAMLASEDQLGLLQHANELNRQAQELDERAASLHKLSPDVTKAGTTA